MNLQNATKRNVKWSFIESISLKLVGFVLSIILARLLTPSDFGVLAIVNVFYLMTILFIDGGLREALVQKKDASENDFSTMFWLNIGVAVLFYMVLFVSAPFIENFYKFEHLSFYIRLQSLTLIIEAFGLIQIVKATKELNLKKITLARIPATIISFLVGIGMAYSGFGIVSLIVQQLVNAGLYTLFLVYNVRYKPTLLFSKQSLQSLYGFGLKLFVVSYINRMYVQSLNLLYAFFFSTKELGFYTKSKSLQGVPIDIIDSAFTKGLYPTMVKVQQHNRLLRKLFLFNVRRLTLVMVLLNGILFFNAREIILFLLGEKWSEMAPYLQIAAVGSLFYPINNQVISIFKAKGKANTLLKLETSWKITALVMIITFSILTNFFTVLWVIVILNSIMGFVYLYFCSKSIQFSFLTEFKTLLLLFFFYYTAGFIANEIALLFKFNFFLIVKVIIFTMIYFTFALLFGLKFKEFNLLKLMRFK